MRNGQEPKNDMEIRYLRKDDLPTRVEWMNNPAIYSRMHYDVPVTLENTEKWFEKNVGNVSRADMVVTENGEILSFCGIVGIDRNIGKGEIYDFVNPCMLHQGVGSMSRRLLCSFAFNHESLKLNKLFAYTNEDNIPSIRVFEKLGFKLEGRLRKEYVSADGKLLDRLYYGLLREEWIKITF